MSRWFRSEPMEYISLIVNEDAAHDCLSDLGKLGVIQFTDVGDMCTFMMIDAFLNDSHSLSLSRTHLFY